MANGHTMYLLDSDICINLLRGKLPHTFKLMRNSDPRIFGIPTVVEGELRTGALKSGNPQKNKQLIENFLAPYKSVPFDQAASVAYSEIRAALERHGDSIGPNDLLIAATAVSRGATLVTGNLREFGRVEGLDAENWEEIDL